MAGQDPDVKRSVSDQSISDGGWSNACCQGLLRSMSRSRGSLHGGVRFTSHQARAWLAQRSRPNINPCADYSDIE